MFETEKQLAKQALKEFDQTVNRYKAGQCNEAEVNQARERFQAAHRRYEELSGTAPVTRLAGLKNPADARLPGDAHAHTMSTHAGPLAREAYALEQTSIGHRNPATENHIQCLKGESEVYARLGFDEQGRELHNRLFNAWAHGGYEGPQIQAPKEDLFSLPGGREKWALLTTSGEVGGFLVPEDFKREVIKDLVGLSVFRQVARVVRTSSDVAVHPTVTAPTTANSKKGFPSKFAGGWGAQADQSGNSTLSTQTQPTFGQERIQIHRYQPDAVELSLELLEDSSADVGSLLAEIMAETRSIDENSAFTEGDGSDRPLGITQESLTAVNSGDASTLQFNPGSAKGLLGLIGALPAQYRVNASFMMNSLTYIAALGLENNSTGHSLVFPQTSQPMLRGGRGSLMSFPVAINEYMPDIAGNAYPIIFGDFSKGYVIADRMELRVQRLVEKVAPNVAFLAMARMGGQCVRPNAFVRQKVAA